MSEGPALLMDVDGVLVVPALGRPDEEFEAVIDPVDDYRLPLGTRDRVARLEQAFRCVWCTAWEDRVASLTGAFGFGSGWPLVRFTSAGGSATRKLPDVRRWVSQNARDRKVAWVDDDLLSDAREWADRRGDVLLVRTRFDQGLTEDQAIELLAWGRPR